MGGLKHEEWLKERRGCLTFIFISSYMLLWSFEYYRKKWSLYQKKKNRFQFYNLMHYVKFKGMVCQ